MQRLKCSVAESEGHRIVFHNLNLTVMRKEIHIVSNPNRGGWDAKRPNADRASKHFDTKKEAMEWSRDLAKREGLELIPHGTDGQIQNPNSYGKKSQQLWKRPMSTQGQKALSIALHGDSRPLKRPAIFILNPANTETASGRVG